MQVNVTPCIPARAATCQASIYEEWLASPFAQNAPTYAGAAAEPSSAGVMPSQPTLEGSDPSIRTSGAAAPLSAFQWSCHIASALLVAVVAAWFGVWS